MKQQVLIVDDEPELLLSISSGFEKNDRFQITTAHNGREALDILSGAAMDLVVTDLRMPVMDGVELLAAMTESFPKVPNIVMTAFGTPVMEQQLKKAGTMEVLEKPLDIDDLEQAVDIDKRDVVPDHVTQERRGCGLHRWATCPTLGTSAGSRRTGGSSSSRERRTGWKSPEARRK